ncbi:MAG: 16S rRNA (cytidine(1402)-2'-O)-methyltransferase [Candidatus Accumulibacter sp.]|jgi:16S rRNA (cytidine1402-2'-O)-methyltransferase|nr:16S rRNA (cytidine(1402)-2'-O)-methyltransferase [Accumulibacter sp.]
MTKTSPALYVVPTPIGNLDDITQRAIDVLRSVDWIAAEDTRHSMPLLKRIGATARTFPLHSHNEEGATSRLVDCLSRGESVALVSDAGTPAVSDPGSLLVARARQAGFRVIPLPGPCAAVTAFSASGLGCTRFLFYGFLPPRAKAREDVLRSLLECPYTLIFYEAPHRVLETVDAMAAIFGPGRGLVLARELTKLFETIHSCPLGDASAWLCGDENRLRGEFVLLLSGWTRTANASESGRVLRLLLDEGLSVKQAAKLASAITGEGKKTLYERALAFRESENFS